MTNIFDTILIVESIFAPDEAFILNADGSASLANAGFQIDNVGNIIAGSFSFNAGNITSDFANNLYVGGALSVGNNFGGFNTPVGLSITDSSGSDVWNYIGQSSTVNMNFGYHPSVNAGAFGIYGCNTFLVVGPTFISANGRTSSMTDDGSGMILQADSISIGEGACTINNNGDLYTSSEYGLKFSNGTYLRVGSFDNGTGGGDGISLICAVDYELNWQGGHLGSWLGSSYAPIIMDSDLYFTNNSHQINTDGSASFANGYFTTDNEGNIVGSTAEFQYLEIQQNAWIGGTFNSDSGDIYSDGYGNFTAATLNANNGFTGAGAYTTLTIVNGIITAAS